MEGPLCTARRQLRAHSTERVKCKIAYKAHITPQKNLFIFVAHRHPGPKSPNHLANFKRPTLLYILVWCPRVGYFDLPMICLKSQCPRKSKSGKLKKKKISFLLSTLKGIGVVCYCILILFNGLIYKKIIFLRFSIFFEVVPLIHSLLNSSCRIKLCLHSTT